MFFASSRDIYESYVVTGSVLLVVSARFIVSHFVWVGLFGVDSVLVFDVVKSVVHETTVAAHVTFFFRAIDQVLLGETWEHAILSHHLAFERTSCAETPARAALPLVLNPGDVASFSPIDVGWEAGFFKVCWEHVGGWSGGGMKKR